MQASGWNPTGDVEWLGYTPAGAIRKEGHTTGPGRTEHRQIYCMSFSDAPLVSLTSSLPQEPLPLTYQGVPIIIRMEGVRALATAAAC